MKFLIIFKLPINQFLVKLFFYKNYGKPDSKEKRLVQYNLSYGRVNDEMSSRIERGCNKLLSETSKDIVGTLYKYVGLPRPTDQELANMFTKNVTERGAIVQKFL